ncbi:hypothetical protein EUTSA_v10009377mg, partial [Eutrema salsugineum]
ISQYSTIMMKRGVKILDSVPIDLFLEIFSRLPSKSISRFRCVSKLWGSMLHRQYFFTELFLTRSSARPRLLFILQGLRECSVFSSPQLQNPYGKSSSLVVSADFHVKFSRDMWPAEFCGFTCGLIYFYSMRISEKKGDDKVPVIFNPTTRQYASLPETDRFSRSFLGFDPIDKQFKVLSMPFPKFSNDHRILTLGTGEMSWKKIQCPLIHYLLSKEICINDVLYYLAETSDDEEVSIIVVCFDVRAEKFKIIEVEESFYYATLINYKGKLGGIRQKYDGDSNTLELHMWVLEDVEKWSKNVYTLPADKIVDFRIVSVVGVTATGEIVLSMRHTSKSFYVSYFNPERKTLQHVEIQGFGAYYDENRHRVVTFVDYVEDLNVNDAKYLKSSQCLNITRQRPKLPKPQNRRRRNRGQP